MVPKESLTLQSEKKINPDSALDSAPVDESPHTKPLASEPFASGPPIRSEVDEKVESFFSIKALFSFLRFDGTDAVTGASSVFLSDLNSGLALGWHQRWSPRIESHLSIDYQTVRITPITGKTLDPSSLPLTGFGGGAQWQVNEKWALDTSLSSGQEIFWKATGFSALSPRSVPITRAIGGLAYNAVKVKHLKLQLTAGWGLAMATSSAEFSIKNGTLYRLGTELISEDSRQPISVGFGYEKLSQSTDISDHSRIMVTGFVKYYFGGIKN